MLPWENRHYSLVNRAKVASEDLYSPYKRLITSYKISIVAYTLIGQPVLHDLKVNHIYLQSLQIGKPRSITVFYLKFGQWEFY